MPEVTNTQQNAPIEDQLQHLNLLVAKAQLQKLQLEIKNLKPKRQMIDGIVRLIPIITAALSIGGFLWGINLYLAQQEKDRQTREEERISRDQTQYRTSYDQLLQFSTNPNVTVHKVLFLRDDIYKLIDSMYPPDKQLKDNEAAKAKLKASIFGLLTKECDFTQMRHVQMDIAAMEEWKDYEKDLKGLPNKTYIDKYIQAIQSLHTRDPKYIESVTYSKGGFTESQAPTEPLSNSFRSLVEGFSLHLQRLEKKDQADAIAHFHIVTGNPTLTADLFSSDNSNPGP